MPIGFDFSTVAQFHFSYLKEMLKERNMIYTKKKPNGVVEESSLNSLIGRAKKTDHLQSFKTLLDFCERTSLQEMKKEDIVSLSNLEFPMYKSTK